MESTRTGDHNFRKPTGRCPSWRSALPALPAPAILTGTVQFPLTLRFKILALAPQVSATDAAGQPVCYVKQKMLKLKERVEVFTDESRTEKLAEINADKIIDWSANYTFTDPAGNAFGSVRRAGMKSLWRAHYEIMQGDAIAFTLREGNPWSKFMDSLFEGIPIIGAFSGYVFHPRYEVRDASGTLCYELSKKPALLESIFIIEEKQETGDDILVLLAILMMSLLERERG